MASRQHLKTNGSPQKVRIEQGTRLIGGKKTDKAARPNHIINKKYIRKIVATGDLVTLKKTMEKYVHNPDSGVLFDLLKEAQNDDNIFNTEIEACPDDAKIAILNQCSEAIRNRRKVQDEEEMRSPGSPYSSDIHADRMDSQGDEETRMKWSPEDHHDGTSDDRKSVTGPLQRDRSPDDFQTLLWKDKKDEETIRVENLHIDDIHYQRGPGEDEEDEETIGDEYYINGISYQREYRKDEGMWKESQEEAYNVAHKILTTYPALVKVTPKNGARTILRDAVKADAYEIVKLALSVDGISDAEKAEAIEWGNSKQGIDPLLDQVVNQGEWDMFSLFIEVKALQILPDCVKKAVERCLEPGSGSYISTLRIARELLHRCPEAITLKLFENVVTRGNIILFHILLNDEFKGVTNKELEGSTILETAVTCKHGYERLMIQCLSERYPQQVNFNLFSLVVKNDLVKAWNLLIGQPQAQKILENSTILHLAVKYKRLPIVQSLVENWPSLCLIDDHKDDPNPVLHHNTPDKKDQEEVKIRKAIRDVIAPIIISDSEPSRARKLLCDDLGNRLEIGLFLPTFHQDPEGCKSFLRNIIPGQISTIGVRFETALKYVELSVPAESVAKALSWKKDHLQVTGRAEIFLILKWLHKEGVKKICELHVKDSLYHPHSEEDIERLEQYCEGVEVLDWRRVDISMETVKKAAPNVKTLHLYASGWAALSHWMGPDGLISGHGTGCDCQATSLSGRDDGRIVDGTASHVVEALPKDNMGSSKASEYEKVVYTRLKIIRDRLKILRGEQGPDFIYEVHQNKWEDVQGKIVTITYGEPAASTPLEKARLRTFHEGYKSLFQSVRCSREDPPKQSILPLVLASEDNLRTKVAIIDSGISQSFPRPSGTGTGDNRITGTSFIHEDNRESPWYCPTDTHGTQMASIIRELDPECNLFVARACTTKYDVKRENVAQAMRWAIEQKVDIISLSLSVDGEGTEGKDCPEDINSALLAAREAGIAVLCSTSDQGQKKTTVWPASHEDAIAIASADSLGHPMRDTFKKYRGYYYFEGEDIAVGGVMVKGSSVATAMAAGVASLIMACYRAAKNIEELEPDCWVQKPDSGEGTLHQWDIIDKCFRKMAEESEVDRSFCMPFKFFPERPNDWHLGSAASVREWIMKKFQVLSSKPIPEPGYILVFEIADI